MGATKKVSRQNIKYTIMRRGEYKSPFFMPLLFEIKTKKATLQMQTYFYRNFNFLG